MRREVAIFSIVALAFIIGCCGPVTAFGERRYALNGVYASATGDGLIILDFNYTPASVLPEITFNLGKDFTDVYIEGNKCEFTPRNGLVLNKREIFRTDPHKCIDGRECNIFDIGPIFDRTQIPLHIMIDGFVDERCTQLIRNGANVSFSISSTENQNDLGDVLNPYRERVSGTIEIRNVTGMQDIENTSIKVK